MRNVSHVCMPVGSTRPRVARRAWFVALLLLGRIAAAETDGMVAFPPDADTYVHAGARGRSFGTARRLWVSGAPVRQSFLRFTVTGIGARVVGQAILRLTVAPGRRAASSAGGRVHLVTDNGWTEAGTTYHTRPPVDGPVLAQQGAVGVKQTVDFDVTAAVVGDGTYSFALESPARDAVWYRSRQARSGRPELRVMLAPEPKPEVLGVEDLGFGPAVETAVNKATAQKPESKLWFHDGTWWAALFAPGAGEYRIHRLDPATDTWIDTGTFVDERPMSRQDVLSDGAGLYMVSRFDGAPPESRLLRYTYSPASRSHVLDPGFPVRIPGGGTESMTLARDSGGTLWIAYTLNDQVFVASTLGSDLDWSAPFVVPVGEGTTVDPDDIAGVQRLPGGIGVFWSNQLTDKFYFAVHRDGAPAADPAAWQLEIAAAGGNVADDHFNLKLASDGRLFAAVKTSRSNPSSTLIGLLVRSPGGVWSPLHKVTDVDFHPTRPLCMLDEAARRVYVFYSLDQSAIYYKTSDVDSLAFPDGSGTPFIVSTLATDINNPTSTKQNVDAGTGLVVLASSSERMTYWHRRLDLAPPMSTR
ncbi:MAG: DNRLRE domain-containing protein [Deltaproteobacteria bacterium]|nr:MAG: DNRLRE domain-containing protein [Deltaproteobacteria bacterium]